MAQITRQQYELQLQHIFRLLLEANTEEEIAKDLQISVRTVQRYKQRLDQRYGEAQRQKTEDTLFTECQLFKNRMLRLYKALEIKALSDKTSGVETAKCCEVAADIANSILRLESEGKLYEKCYQTVLIIITIPIKQDKLKMMMNLIIILKKNIIQIENFN
jgi:hypothetical protein